MLEHDYAYQTPPNARCTLIFVRGKFLPLAQRFGNKEGFYFSVTDTVLDSAG